MKEIEIIRKLALMEEILVEGKTPPLQDSSDNPVSSKIIPRKLNRCIVFASSVKIFTLGGVLGELTNGSIMTHHLVSGPRYGSSREAFLLKKHILCVF